MEIKKYLIKGVSYLRRGISRLNSKHVVLSVAELFQQHNTESGFLRYDIIVRLLAIEQYYHKNDYGYEMYRKMQNKRLEQDVGKVYLERFCLLIQSYEEKGYDSKSEVELDKNLMLLDGSHRLAIAIYRGIPEISAIVRPYMRNVFYGIEWFYVNGFNDDECLLLKRKHQELVTSLNTPFVCTLWHPSNMFFDDITNNLSLFGDVTELYDYEVNRYIYEHLIDYIYSVDDIEKWKIDKKKEYILSGDNDKYKIRLVFLNIKSPWYRLKSKNQYSISQTGEHIKRLIRNGYKNRIPNYYYDIIVHIGDNLHHNHHLRALPIKIERYEKEGYCPSERLLTMLSELKAICKRHDIVIEKVCVVGSAVLSLYGIRENRDLDLIVDSAARKRFGNKLFKLSDNIEIVAKGWARSNNRDVIPDDEIISNSLYHIEYSGIKFASMELLYERKLYQHRLKDMEDATDIKLWMGLRQQV